LATLELGGNAPCVILDDADLDHAVRATVIGRFLHQGQICMSTNRIIVDAKLHDELVEKFVAHVKGLKCGDPSDPEVAIGPIINKKQLAGHIAHIQGARAAGAEGSFGWRSRRPSLASAHFCKCQERYASRSGRNVRADRAHYQGRRRI
jgi:aldehyde dehydrogenase (NAD+)